ncbi:MAG: extracellular solute-binding protein [Firmicutes bacterium]|nr:extracellular solute-binding protein [Bacillota bacterium]
MKRAMIRIILLCMLAATLTGCAGGNSDSSTTAPKPVTITIWHDKEDAVADVLQKALDALAPDIAVKLEKKAGLTEALKMVGNDKNAAPDMYWFAHDKLGVYAEMGILAPIGDFIADEELADYIPMTLRAGMYKGTRYQMPLYFETLLFLYNRKYMKDADVPATTEALYGYMKRKTHGGHYGFVEQHSTAYYSAGWLHAFGTEVLNAQGQPHLDDENVINALTYHLKFVELMPDETEYATVNTLFREGMAHATLAGPWLVPTLREAGIDVGVAPMPVVDETGLPLAPYSGVQGLHVLKVHAREKKDAIMKVLTALLEPQIGTDLALVSACAPANGKCYGDERITSDAAGMEMRRTAETAVPMPNLPEMDVMWTVLGNLLTDVNMRGQDVAEAAAQAQRQAAQLIEAMR